MWREPQNNGQIIVIFFRNVLCSGCASIFLWIEITFLDKWTSNVKIMKESKHTTILTFYAQYVRRKKLNILIGTFLTTSFVVFLQTTSKTKYIQNDFLNGKKNTLDKDTSQGKLLWEYQIRESFLISSNWVKISNWNNC